MMRRAERVFTVMAALLVVFTLGYGAKVGDPAPAFAVKDTKGMEHKLSDFKGKYVVLEWQNKDCPFLQKHYNTNNMQKLQREWTAKGMVWLTVLSSASGKQGYLTGAQADTWVAEKKAYKASPKDSPPGADTGENRVVRGGSWSDSADSTRTAYRGWEEPEILTYNVGMRVVLPVR